MQLGRSPLVAQDWTKDPNISTTKETKPQPIMESHTKQERKRKSYQIKEKRHGSYETNLSMKTNIPSKIMQARKHSNLLKSLSVYNTNSGESYFQSQG